MKKIVKRLVVIALALAVAFAAFGCSFRDASSGSGKGEYSYSSALAENVNIVTSSTDGRTELSYKAAINKVKRASVAVKMEYNSTSGSGTNQGSWGAGTIIAVEDDNPNEYYVVTCQHVIENRGNITVYVPDDNGKNYTDAGYNLNYAFTGVIDSQIYADKAITLVGGDTESDVAVLKLTVPENLRNSVNIEEAVLPPTGYSLVVGEEVFAIGNPEGDLPGTTTKGYIAYDHLRSVALSGIGTLKLIQINVDIWHGSSGGGLFNMYGEFVGMTNSGSDEDSGINYAVPLSTSTVQSEDNGLYEVMRQLIGTAAKNSSNYGYVSGRVAKFGFTCSFDQRGLRVSSVTTGSLAYNAGLRVGDLIVSASVNDKAAKEYSSVSEFTELMNTLVIGDRLTLNVQHSNGFWLTTETYEINMVKSQYRFCDTGVADPVSAE